MSIEKRAKSYAEKWHGSIDQRRKYTGDPYTVHTQAVADLVKEHGGDEYMVAAAHLHDVVEDTPCTIGQIYLAFGHSVGYMVSGLTDVSAPEDGNRKTRKTIDRMHVSSFDWRVQTIKCADLIHNTFSIVEHDPGFASVYLEEKRDLLRSMPAAEPEIHARACAVMNAAFEELTNAK